MTVIKISLVSWEGNESLNEVGYRTRYFARTDDRDDGPFTVRSAMGVTYGSPYLSGNDSDPRAVANNIKESQISSSDFNHWLVDVTYKNPDGQESDNPLLDPVQETWSWDGVTREIQTNAAGFPIFNTADDPMAYASEAIDNTPTLNYSLNQIAFNSTLAQQVRNGVNSTTWKGFLPRVVRVNSMSSSTKFHKSVGTYFEVTYSFSVNPDTWQESVDSYGWREKKDIGGLKKKVNRPGSRAPLPLDNNGEFIDDPLQAPAQVLVTKYPEFDFNTLFPFL